MADQEKWELSREEIDERLRKLKQKKVEPTRGGRSSGQEWKMREQRGGRSGGRK